MPTNATMAVLRAGHFGIVAVGILLFTELQALCYGWHVLSLGCKVLLFRKSKLAVVAYSVMLSSFCCIYWGVEARNLYLRVRVSEYYFVIYSLF